jgi:hypothetical protein
MPDFEPGGPSGRSDAVLLEAARAQLATVLASGNPGAFLGWWEAWTHQPGVDRDDLAELLVAAGSEEVPDQRWFGIDHTAHLVRCGLCGSAVLLGVPQADHERFHAALDALAARLAQIGGAVNTPLTG